MTTETKVQVILPEPHPHQAEFIDSDKKRIMIRAGRRGGKTVGMAIRNVKRFLEGRRQLYATPTIEQLQAWWYEVTLALDPLVQMGVFRKNETEHYIELPGTKQRIKGKTASDVNTFRGDYADDITFDEYQLMSEDVWEVVGQPMLMDNNGDAAFIYTPPSLTSSGQSKARDPRHAAKLFKKAMNDDTWLALHFTSHDNPHISREALASIAGSMSKQSYRQEISAEDDELQLSWLVYRAFNEGICRVSRQEIPKDWPVYVGHDFGQANPAALFFARDIQRNELIAFNEYLPGAGRSTSEHVEEFKRITEGMNVVARVGGNWTTEEEIRQGYTAHGWPITKPRFKEPKLQIDRVVGLMERNQIKVHSNLFFYLDELMNCLWKPDEEGRPTDKINNEERYHLCAAARYVLSEFTPETVVNSKPRSKRSGRF